MAVRRIPFIPVRVPIFDRHSDRVDDFEKQCRVEVDGRRVMLIPTDATHTRPYLVSFELSDIQEAIRP